jgi:hypothetical protein
MLGFLRESETARMFATRPGRQRCKAQSLVVWRRPAARWASVSMATPVRARECKAHFSYTAPCVRVACLVGWRGRRVCFFFLFSVLSGATTPGDERQGRVYRWKTRGAAPPPAGATGSSGGVEREEQAPPCNASHDPAPVVVDNSPRDANIPLLLLLLRHLTTLRAL